MTLPSACKEGASPMIVKFHQTGGFAPPINDKKCEFNTESMQSDEAHRLVSLVERSRLAELQTQKQEPSKGADYMSYTIIVETETGAQKVSFNDTNMPDSIVPLLEYLVEHCR
jgi:hypothetical protein